MDWQTLFSLIFTYVLKTFYVNSFMAFFAYAYYVRLSAASRDVRDRFLAGVSKPAKWIVTDQKPFIGSKSVRFWLNSTDFEKRVESRFSLRDLELIRLLIAAVALLITGLVFGFMYVFSNPSGKLLCILYVVADLATLFASFRFGHRLIDITQASSTTLDSLGK